MKQNEIQTIGDLRMFLSSCISDVKSGVMTPDQGVAICKICRIIHLTLKEELEEQMHNPLVGSFEYKLGALHLGD